MSGEEADVITSVIFVGFFFFSYLTPLIDRSACLLHCRASPVWMISGPPHLATPGQIMI